MLESSIKRYHNKILTAAEVMDELIKLSKEIVNMDSEAKAFGLMDFEYTFYHGRCQQRQRKAAYTIGKTERICRDPDRKDKTKRLHRLDN